MYYQLFLNLKITRSDIRPHIKCTVSLVIAYGHLIFLTDLCQQVWLNILTLLPPMGIFQRRALTICKMDRYFNTFP